MIKLKKGDLIIRTPNVFFDLVISVDENNRAKILRNYCKEKKCCLVTWTFQGQYFHDFIKIFRKDKQIFPKMDTK